MTRVSGSIVGFAALACVLPVAALATAATRVGHRRAAQHYSRGMPGLEITSTAPGVRINAVGEVLGPVVDVATPDEDGRGTRGGSRAR